MSDTTKEAEKLKARGFDGLYAPRADCGCFLDDLRPCGEARTGCRGGLALERDGLLGVFKPSFVLALRRS